MRLFKNTFDKQKTKKRYITSSIVAILQKSVTKLILTYPYLPMHFRIHFYIHWHLEYDKNGTFYKYQTVNKRPMRSNPVLGKATLPYFLWTNVVIIYGYKLRKTVKGNEIFVCLLVNEPECASLKNIVSCLVKSRSNAFAWIFAINWHRICQTSQGQILNSLLRKW